MLKGGRGVRGGWSGGGRSMRWRLGGGEGDSSSGRTSESDAERFATGARGSE